MFCCFSIIFKLFDVPELTLLINSEKSGKSLKKDDFQLVESKINAADFRKITISDLVPSPTVIDDVKAAIPRMKKIV